MTALLFIASVVLLYISPLAAQSEKSQTEPYGFHDIQLGMSIAEFKAKHRAPKVEKYTSPSASPLPGEATCAGGMKKQQRNDLEVSLGEVTRCDYGEKYPTIPLQVSAMFVEGKLAVIVVEPPSDSAGCFEPPALGSPTSQQYFYKAGCQQYPQLLQALTRNLGPATPIIPVNDNLKDYVVWRWENDSSVAEFEHHMCGPWGDGADGGWGNVISEVLEGTYCGPGDLLNSRQPVMLYVHKELGRTLVKR
jgi:hypothetical protein